jgi:putative transposase
MSKKSQYISTNHSKHYLKAHIIIVTKYRKPLLRGTLNANLKTIFKSIEQSSDFSIEVLESDLDHIHFLIRYIPRLSISQIVRRLKQQSTYQLWQKHSVSLAKQYWLNKTFWSSGYFACSIGEASPATIRQYILSQG